MESSLIGKTVYIGGKKPNEKSIEQKRGDILEGKLTLINDYLVNNMNDQSGKSLDDFLKENNLTKEEFTKDLPDGLNKPKSDDFDALVKYGEALNDEYFKQYLLHEEKTNNLSANGVVGVDYLAMADGSGANFNAIGDKAKEALERAKAALAKAAKEAKDAADKALAIAQQNAISIKEGLGKSPQEILNDLKNEVKKDVKDLGTKIPVALNVVNKLNPIAVIGRNATLGLISQNAMGLATHFDALRKDGSLWAKALQRWSLLGGDPSVFSSTITKAKDKPRLFEGVLKMVHKNADGSYNASAEDVQTAIAAGLQAQKDYDDAVKKNKTTNIAAKSLGVAAGSSAAVGGLLTAGAFGPAGIPIGAPVVTAGATLASFIPIINMMKIGVGEAPDTTPPEADPIVPPQPGEEAISPRSSTLLTPTVKKVGLIIGATIVVTGLGVAIYKYAK